MHKGTQRLWWAWRVSAVVGLLLTGLVLGGAGSASAGATSAPAWEAQTLPGTGPGVELTAVSCSSATSCMAVGNDILTNAAVSEAWNGHVWHSVPMANPADPSPTNSYSIGAVSCASSKACVAVGVVEGRIDLHTLAEVWNGTSWSTTAAVAAGNAPALDAVSCVTADDCIAVGDFTSPGAPDSSALAEQWNGRSWTRILHAQSTAPLDAVSCSSASLCFAGGPLLSGLERWDGRGWTLVDRGVVSTHLLSCASTDSCLAVGCAWASTCLNDGAQNSFAWNGSSWRRVTTGGAKRQNLLQGLSCVSASSCVAVGGLQGSSTAVAARWNGQYWTLERDPAAVPGLQLRAVDCVGAGCEAMGLVPQTGNYGAPIALGES
jgi:hypothetical protein